MSKKYTCSHCDYETDIHCNFKKHNKSKKHRQIVNGKSLTEDDSIMCQYCKRTISHKRHLDRHYNTCKAKKEHDMKSLYSKLVQSEEQKMELQKQKDEMYQMYTEQIKMLIGKITGGGKTSNYNKLNTAFVIGHFNEAHNLEDLLKPKLTTEEIEFLMEEPTVNGCYRLLKSRCIDGIEIDKRPIHLVDVSRKKYLIRTKGDWTQDVGGFKILEALIDNLGHIWATMPGKDNQDMLFIKSQKLLELNNNGHKVLNYLNDYIVLKNNALKIYENEKKLADEKSNKTNQLNKAKKLKNLKKDNK